MAVFFLLYNSMGSRAPQSLAIGYKYCSIYDLGDNFISKKRYWMKNLTVIALVCIFFNYAHGQDIDSDLLIIKHQLEGVIEAKARATLELDVNFINMPKKTADLHFQKGKPISYASDNFIIIPKRGLDFSWNELFKYKFMTVDRGTTEIQGETLKVLNVIPLDKKADFAIMTLKIDATLNQIIEAEITTRNEGTYSLLLAYDSSSLFPEIIIVEFELERIRIPLNFMGKDASIDSKELKSEKVKSGKIYLTLDWKYITIAR